MKDLELKLINKIQAHIIKLFIVIIKIEILNHNKAQLLNKAIKEVKKTT